MLVRIVVDSSETSCLVQTARSELLYIDLTEKDQDEEVWINLFVEINYF